MFFMIRRTAAARRIVAVAVAGLCAGSLLTACGSESSGSGSGSGDRLSVVASFYPLQYAAERVAGNAANVVNLTKPGAEPHDLELSPRSVGSVSEADLVVYLRGLQPAVDSAVNQEAGGHSLDVTGAAKLTLPAPHAGEDGHGEHEHGNQVEGGEETDSVASGKDPHFWLDPLRLAAVGDAVAKRLAAVDPGHAAAFRANAAKLRADLTKLDREFRTGLKTCRTRDLVTSHAAFGYLAARYGFTQFGITGLSPDQEPSPAELSSAATFARRHDVRTIYHETLVSPAVAKTVARETGAASAVLDPLEGLTSESAGKDYLAVMRANLATLVKGQECS